MWNWLNDTTEQVGDAFNHHVGKLIKPLPEWLGLIVYGVLWLSAWIGGVAVLGFIIRWFLGTQ